MPNEIGSKHSFPIYRLNVTLTAQSSDGLFGEWDEADSQMTEAERRAEDTAWESFKNSINAERAEAGMRLLF